MSDEALYRLAVDELAAEDDNFSNDTIPWSFVLYGNRPTEMRINRIYVELYCGWMNFFVHNLLPYVLLIVLNTLILKELEQFSRGDSADSPIGNNVTLSYWGSTHDDAEDYPEHVASGPGRGEQCDEPKSR